MRSFDYSSARTVDEALARLGEAPGGAARPLAGGTDLLTLMKADIVAPIELVNLKQAADLPRGISAGPAGVSIGALTTLSEIERDPLLLRQYAPLAQAAGLAATPQLRNMATIAGNLLQRPRCWYFRSPDVRCWLQGGDECQARDGENQLHALFDVSPCVAVHPSDLATALVALDAAVRLRGPGGERTLPLAELLAPPDEARRTETTLGEGELILSVELPAPLAGTRGAYLKAMDRKVWAFALVGVAAVLRLGGPGGRRVEDARLVLGGVAPVPWRATAAEAVLRGAELDEATAARAAVAALSDARPLAHNGYKLPLAEALIRRALASLAAA